MKPESMTKPKKWTSGLTSEAMLELAIRSGTYDTKALKNKKKMFNLEEEEKIIVHLEQGVLFFGNAKFKRLGK